MNAVVVANGEFRVDRSFRAFIARADLVVACDGAAGRLLDAGVEIDAAVGDGDSIPAATRERLGERFIRVEEQQTSDLAKALRFCREAGAEHVLALGISGGREDHLMGNVFRLLDFTRDFESLAAVTPHGVFTPIEGEAGFDVERGVAISVFAPDPRTRAVSEGLEWPLDGVKFRSLADGTLNRAVEPRVTIRVDRPVIVYTAKA